MNLTLLEYSTTSADKATIDRTLPGAATPDQSEPGSDGNEEVSRIPQSSIIKASLSNCLVSYAGHLLEEFYLSAEMQSVYSAAPADWATNSKNWPQRKYVDGKHEPNLFNK